mgnify:CR=1 FL=1
MVRERDQEIGYARSEFVKLQSKSFESDGKLIELAFEIKQLKTDVNYYCFKFRLTYLQSKRAKMRRA